MIDHTNLGGLPSRLQLDLSTMKLHHEKKKIKGVDPSERLKNNEFTNQGKKVMWLTLEEFSIVRKYKMIEEQYFGAWITQRRKV